MYLSSCLVLLQSAVVGTSPLEPQLVRAAAWLREPIRVGARDAARAIDARHRLPIALPLSTLCELEARVSIESERVCVGFPSTTDGCSRERPTLSAVLHPLEQRVLRADACGEPLCLVVAARLPRDASREIAGAWESQLPQLARRDDHVLPSGARLRIECDAGSADDRLALFGPLRDGTGDVTLLALPDSATPFALPHAVDELAIVRVAPLEGTPSLVLRGPRLADGDFEWDAPPVPPAGMTWTLLLDVPDSSGTTATLAERPAVAPRDAAAPASAADAAWVDVAVERGIDFVHLEGPQTQLDIRPTMGPGLAWGDFDADGWNDLYLAQGAGRDGSRAPLDRVFRNEAGARFRDVTVQSGIRDTSAGMGVICFDADGDADLDAYVANYGRDRLYTNDGTARFTDATDAAGIAGERWHAGVAAGDFDLDGDLDVYVTSYVDYDVAKMPPREELAYQRDDPIEMLPFAFAGQPNTLWRNDTEHGAARFVDVARELRVDDPSGRGMQPLWWDYDDDADLDLYVANDVSPNKLFRNEGNGAFKDVSFSAGVDDPRGSMGLAAEDIDGDLDLDLFVTNWQLEANALYLNNLVNARSQKSHTATFRDAILQARLGQPSVGFTKWGVEVFDADLDGDADVFYSNGYTSPDYESTGSCVGQPCHYFTQRAPLQFQARTHDRSLELALAHRALAACDYDQDGDLDLALSANNGPFRLLEYRGERDGHWLGIRLRESGDNPYAIGARVRVRAGGREWMRELRAGASYLAGDAPELHFGIGKLERVESIEVRWPDGHRTQHVPEGVDRWLTLGAAK